MRIKNRTTGLYLDGQGRTANGSAVGQYSASTSTNQQWSVVTDANNVQIKNRATGLYLDGMGRTADGSDLGQYSHSSSTNQQWQILAAADRHPFRHPCGSLRRRLSRRSSGTGPWPTCRSHGPVGALTCTFLKAQRLQPRFDNPFKNGWAKGFTNRSPLRNLLRYHPEGIAEKTLRSPPRCDPACPATCAAPTAWK